LTNQLVGTTANFSYLYNDSLVDPVVAKADAEYLLQSGTCETDLSVMEGWFAVSGGFGPGNRINVVIDRSGALGSNHGYQTGGATTIQVAPFDPDQPADNPGLGTTTRQAQVRAVFVAEFAEVLMSYRTQVTGDSTWDHGANSMGEALSTVCEALRHPDGYYGGGLGPRITTWLNASPRPNWVDNTEPTDRDFLSIGCGAAFIYYLMSEFNYSISSVIQASGGTFSQLCQNLTGLSGAWASFSQRMQDNYPAGQTYQPTSDDMLPHPGRGPGLIGFGAGLAAGWKGEQGDDRLFYASFGGTTWDAPAAIPGNSSTGPSLAVFGNRLYAAWKGEHADQRLFYASFGGTTWATAAAIPGNSSIGPSLAVLGNQLYAAWKGEHADQRLFYASFNGNGWSAQAGIPGVASSTGPALAVFGGRLYAVWKGQLDDQRLFYASFNGTSWSPQALIPGTATSSSPSLAVLGSRLYAGWKGASADQELFYASFDGTSWNAQATIPGSATSTGPSLAAFGGRLYAAWKGESTDQRLFYASFDGTNWTQQALIPGNSSPDLVFQ
jgi:hypothetical protein